MRALGRLTLASLTLLVACKSRDTLVVLDIDATATLSGVASFHIEAVIGQQTKSFDVTAPSATLPPAQEVGILVPPDLSGVIQVTVEARDSHGGMLAMGSQSGTIRVSDRIDLTVTLGAGVGADLSAGGNDLAPPNSACSDSCSGTSSLNVCAGDAGVTTSTCALGCIASPAAHCGTFYPSGAVAPADLQVAGLLPITFSNTTPATVLHSDTGVIDGARAANSDPTKLEVQSGIGFHVVDGVGIFDFASITIPDGVMIGLAGPNPVALVSAGDVAIVGVVFAGSDTGLCPPPGPGGGTAGSSTAGAAPVLTSAGGLGAGGNGLAGPNSTYSGGAGGGHGASGGKGGDGIAGAGGAAGAAYDDATLIPLHGGSGGGATGASNVCAGAGGGGVQIVSGGTITIGGGTAVGGVNAGGSGAPNGPAGGGSGGSVLLEAFTINLVANGGIASNGGGGGGLRGGMSGTLSTIAAPGGTAGGNDGVGGVGGVTGAIAGGLGGESAGGGGAVGRIRLNSLTGAASLTGTAFLSPSEADRNSLSLPVATEGKIDIH